MLRCATVNFLFLCDVFVVISVFYFNGSSNVSGCTETCILQIICIICKYLAYIEKKFLEAIQMSKEKSD